MPRRHRAPRPAPAGIRRCARRGRCPRTVTVVSPPDSSTAGRPHRAAPTRNCPVGSLERDRGMHARHVARLALDAVAQHDRRDAARSAAAAAASSACLRARDQLEPCFRRRGSPGFGVSSSAGGEMGERPRPARRCGISRASRAHRRKLVGSGTVGPGGDHRRIVARHVGDRQGHDPCRRRGRGEAAALDRREMLAHAVDLADRGARSQQCPRHRLLVGRASAPAPAASAAPSRRRR